MSVSIEQLCPPAVPPRHVVGWQAGSTQSKPPTQSLSIMSLQ
jgi:hypothetical protein